MVTYTGKRSPHGFKSKEEYDKWYRSQPENKERHRLYIREYYQKHKEELREKDRTRRVKKRQFNVRKKHEGKWMYVVDEKGITEYRGIAEAADKIFISKYTIARSVKLHDGYNKGLKCWFIKSWTQLTNDEVMEIVREKSA